MKNESTIGNPKEWQKNGSFSELPIAAEVSGTSNKKNRKARPQGCARSQLSYWRKALRIDETTRNIYVRIACKGRRGRFTFERNAEVAAETARQIYLCIQRDGWQKALDHYSPGGATRMRKQAEAERIKALGGRVEQPTIGDLIRVAEKFSTTQPLTFHGYVRNLRQVASAVFAVPHSENIPVPSVTRKKSARRHASEKLIRVKDLRYDYKTGGLKRWRGAVEAIKLSSLTPDKVEAWRKSYLQKAGANPAALAHARVSFNKVIRNAKSLFSRKLLPLIEKELILTRPLPFDGVPKEPEPPTRYQSRMDVQKILDEAFNELQSTNLEAFKGFILCLLLGLRRSEADTLLWDNVDFERKEVRVIPTQYYLLKSPDSARPVPLDDVTLATLQGWHARASGPFVLESKKQRNPLARSHDYRCEKTFEFLLAWLRAHGIRAQKPIHELRKEIGTVLLKQKQPIESVSRYLGHSSITITLKYYADLTKQRTTVDLSALMPTGKTIQFPTPMADNGSMVSPYQDTIKIQEASSV